MKGLVTRNTHMHYESSINSGKKVKAKVKVFSKVGQTSRSRSWGQTIWYHVKGLVTSNTHVQYESRISSGKKVMAMVKVLFMHQTRTRMQTPGLWHKLPRHSSWLPKKLWHMLKLKKKSHHGSKVKSNIICGSCSAWNTDFPIDLRILCHV